MKKYKFLIVFASVAFFVSTTSVAQDPPPPPSTEDVPPPGLPIDDGISILAIMALSYACHVIYKNKKTA